MREDYLCSTRKEFLGFGVFVWTRAARRAPRPSELLKFDALRMGQLCPDYINRTATTALFAPQVNHRCPDRRAIGYSTYLLTYYTYAFL